MNKVVIYVSDAENKDKSASSESTKYENLMLYPRGRREQDLPLPTTDVNTENTTIS